MKKLMILAAICGLAASCGTNAPNLEKQGGAEHMPESYLFEKDGCLKADVKRGYADDVRCLDKNKDGCITRSEWDAVMDYWRTHTPQPGQSLCDNS
ncbi:MAG: hypothetical protein LBJ18_00925 [Rickettsiales bacterium]|jgi:hypothetical protein|nr:hypothetical protein [Rickettsiales bacterium]